MVKKTLAKKTLATTAVATVATIAIGAPATDGGDASAMPPVEDIIAMVTDADIDATSRQVERMKALGEAGSAVVTVRMNMIVFEQL